MKPKKIILENQKIIMHSLNFLLIEMEVKHRALTTTVAEDISDLRKTIKTAIDNTTTYLK